MTKPIRLPEGWTLGPIEQHWVGVIYPQGPEGNRAQRRAAERARHLATA